MNVIDGIVQPDSRRYFSSTDNRLRFSSPAVAQQLGVGFVHQEVAALCPDVSVAENIFMSTTNSSGAFLIDYKELYRRSREV